jgi:Xaa-Pro aminopeptidase
VMGFEARGQVTGNRPLNQDSTAKAAGRQSHALQVPFDASMLDQAMDAVGIDVLLVTSKHNVQYLLGGYRYFFFERMDAIGQSRYLPILVYPRGAPERAAYFANRMECFEQELRPLWIPEVHTLYWGTLDAMAAAVDYLKRIGLGSVRIGIEAPFMPVDAYLALRNALPNASIHEALRPLEHLRAIKTPTELDHMRIASDRVVDAMLAVFETHGPGSVKRDIVAALRREEQARGLTFEYCLPTVGTSHNRAPASDETWEIGQPLSLDSGANYEGYIGDLCRMAVLGDPDAELWELLGEILAVQDASVAKVRAGALGRDVQSTGEETLRNSPHRDCMHFVAHGVGLVSHEVPHLTDAGPVPYPAEDATRPLKAGMVLSVETTMVHPRRGFVKLEDTVAVLDQGFEFLGGRGRCWNRGRV